MMKGATLVATICTALVAVLSAAGPELGAPGPEKPTLTAQDYIDIQQLVARYAYALDNCTNNGYDYADLYTEDGWFAASRDGRVGTKSQGRDKLASAARGNTKSCDDVPWKGISHML